MAKPSFVYVTFIRATPEKVWEGLTRPEFTAMYFHKTKIQSEWRPGSPVYYYNEQGGIDAEGKVLAYDRPKLLSFTWHVKWSPAMAQEEPSKVVFALVPMSDKTTQLTVTHDDFPENSATYPAVAGGWPKIIASLKSLLETGQPLDFFA
jgi:uncharacterized protein YndB with AHSA1/START domain